MDQVATEKEIRIKVGLDDKNMPVRINWDADDNPSGMETQDSKAMMISLFDREHLETIKIDLWVKDMQVGEMDRFFFQTLRGMADTYFRATQNSDLARDMQKFVQYFGEQTQIISKDQQ
ncbi:MAG TPA: gliding motility protein GldC [Haliscomenobacter sp.]|uniref:gliding motility protein GldC n=1 Tax=Haliscomenobacter sp. TaxID=2717303 RepID=UPI001DA1B269|nr:gliding motility protein GldC [Haliscomenobacter sp.]MBK9489186.1 gliding motility protein GldC [Haliscomenobacter sp.]HOY16608.1 gliding motility protein GldC [Haliscomenobacter sp.]